jgi:hypothetical protein
MKNTKQMLIMKLFQGGLAKLSIKEFYKKYESIKNNINASDSSKNIYTFKNAIGEIITFSEKQLLNEWKGVQE